MLHVRENIQYKVNTSDQTMNVLILMQLIYCFRSFIAAVSDT